MGRKRLFNDTEKWCARCRAMLPREAFGTHPSEASGLQPYCREHQRAASAARRSGPIGKADRLIRLANNRRKRIEVLETEAENLEALAEVIRLAEITRRELVEGNECIDPGYNPDNTGVL